MPFFHSTLRKMENYNIYPTIPAEPSAHLDPQSYHLNIIQGKQQGFLKLEERCLCISMHLYASQLVRYARCCSNYSDFLIRHRALVKRLLSQGYKVNRLSNTFKKFYGRHTDLVGQYKKNVCQMFADSIS